VDSNREHVRIHKRGTSLFIDVDSEEETVHVSFPLEAATGTLSQLTRQESHWFEPSWTALDSNVRACYSDVHPDIK